MQLKNLNRPLPDLLNYIWEKILTIVWSFYLSKVGKGLHLSRGAKIRGGKHIIIGENFQCGPNVWIEAVKYHMDIEYFPKIHIGEMVRFSDNVHLACTNKIIIGANVLIGSNVHITDHSHGIYTGKNQDDPELLAPVLRALSNDKEVIIENNVWLGDGVIVLPGVRIGRGSIIGANSVVTKSIAENVIAVGSPAVPIKMYNKKLKEWVTII